MARPACATSCAAPTSPRAPSIIISRTRTRSSRRWWASSPACCCSAIRDGRAKATTTAEVRARRTTPLYFSFLVEDPELLALARSSFTAVRTLLDKPDVRALAEALNDDIRAAIAQGILPNIDVSYLGASMAGIAFEISMVMVARDPVDPDAAAEFATRTSCWVASTNAATRARLDCSHASSSKRVSGPRVPWTRTSGGPLRCLPVRSLNA